MGLSTFLSSSQLEVHNLRLKKLKGRGALVIYFLWKLHKDAEALFNDTAAFKSPVIQ